MGEQGDDGRVREALVNRVMRTKSGRKLLSTG
jgi:hypothetical protein